VKARSIEGNVRTDNIPKETAEDEDEEQETEEEEEEEEKEEKDAEETFPYNEGLDFK
jgi:hypothetical protein